MLAQCMLLSSHHARCEEPRARESKDGGQNTLIGKTLD